MVVMVEVVDWWLWQKWQKWQKILMGRSNLNEGKAQLNSGRVVTPVNVLTEVVDLW